MSEIKTLFPHHPSISTAAVPVLLLAALLFSAGLLGAADRVRLPLGVGYAQMHADWPASSWNVAFDLGVLIRTWKTAGFEIGGLLDAGSQYIDVALLADLGFWKSFGREPTPTLILLGASFIGITSGDDDNLGYGAHIGLHQEFWLGGRVGFYARGILRFMFSERDPIYPSLSAGLIIRF